MYQPMQLERVRATRDERGRLFLLYMTFVYYSNCKFLLFCFSCPSSAKAEVSLAVHRVGPTLLLDYLDVPALISYASDHEVG